MVNFSEHPVFLGCLQVFFCTLLYLNLLPLSLWPTFLNSLSLSLSCLEIEKTGGVPLPTEQVDL